MRRGRGDAISAIMHCNRINVRWRLRRGGSCALESLSNPIKLEVSETIVTFDSEPEYVPLLA